MNASKKNLYTNTAKYEVLPMTRGEYNAYRGWNVPANENPTDKGFFINTDDHMAWLTEQAFKRYYKPMSNPMMCNDTRALVARIKLSLKEENAKLSMSRTRTATSKISQNLLALEFVESALNAYEQGKFYKEW